MLDNVGEQVEAASVLLLRTLMLAVALIHAGGRAERVPMLLCSSAAWWRMRVRGALVTMRAVKAARPACRQGSLRCRRGLTRSAERTGSDLSSSEVDLEGRC